MSKEEIKKQFGAHADHYVTSAVHARGHSLARLVAVTGPDASWHALDIATGAGHTALAFAPHVASVLATDLTPEMLARARQLAAEQGVPGIDFELADAEQLPYADGRFDLVTCRIAPHHFADVDAFLAEAARVTRPGGTVAVVDNIVPEGEAGAYMNAYEKLRDPSHDRCLSLREWRSAFARAGLGIFHEETLDKRLELEDWAGRHDATMRGYLRSMLTLAPPEATAIWRPEVSDARTIFHLREALLAARKSEI